METWIKHAFASKFYDPVKAHEYYERTKKLKGRAKRSTVPMSKKQKEVWGYVKSQVMEDKGQKRKEIQNTREQELDSLRSGATAARERIAEKIRTFMANVSNKEAAKNSSDYAALQREKEAISEELKGAVSSAREKARQLKDALNASTETTLDSEYDNVLKNLKKTSKKGGKNTNGQKGRTV